MSPGLKSGRQIIYISSAHDSHSGRTRHHAASKGGINMLMKSMAQNSHPTKLATVLLRTKNQSICMANLSEAEESRLILSGRG